MASRTAGAWPIVDMDHRDLDATDLVGPAFMLNDEGTGGFRVIAAYGCLDSR